MRSFSRREKMSLVWMPPETVSVTKGMGRAEEGGWLLGVCWRVELRVGGKGWKVVDMLRAWGWRVIVVRRARRADLVMGSIVNCGIGVFVGCGGW